MVRVRKAAPADSKAIRRVQVLAFATGAEADLVERLQADGDCVASLVAEDDAVVGHVLLSRMEVSADGRALDALALAPVAVIPDRQGKGIGSALVQAAIDEARKQGSHLVFLLGEPEFYGRFGFDASTAAPFASPYAGPYFQALAIRDTGPVRAGTAIHAPAFTQLG